MHIIHLMFMSDFWGAISIEKLKYHLDSIMDILKKQIEKKILLKC
jgi:hypothetical protein